jgi:hypothetical protein
MIHRRLFLLGSLLVGKTSLANDQPRLTNFRFGIIREVTEGEFEFISETVRIPRKYKASGFRWGFGFDNPQCKAIEWYEVVHLPADLKEVTGNLQRTRTRTMRTQRHSSSQPTIVDDFWFDEGDPLGTHRIELFVNGDFRYAVDFEVIESK